MLLRSDCGKVMGKCDFQALAICVYGWSSRRERRCCCLSCWVLPAKGEERGGPRGTKPREMSGYLLRGCFSSAVMDCGRLKNRVFVAQSSVHDHLTVRGGGLTINWLLHTVLEVVLFNGTTRQKTRFSKLLLVSTNLNEPCLLTVMSVDPRPDVQWLICLHH